MTTAVDSSLALVDEILDIVASAQVKGHDPVDAFMSANEIAPKTAAAFLVRKGMSLLIKEQRADQRLEYKILALDPTYYERMRAEALDRETHTPSQSFLRQQTRKEQEREARLQERIKAIHASAAVLNKAMEFYERWTLPDGTMLGDATREQLLAEAGRERSTADGHLKNAHFYEALARDLKEGETVREGVPLDQAHRIRERVYAPAESVAA